MSELNKILLLDGATKEPVEATLIDGVTITQMEAVDRVWQPYTRQLVREALGHGVSPDQFPEHKHWEWHRKARQMTHESWAFGIECHGEMQALMLVVRRSKACRLEEQSGKGLVYVDYIAAAPWNLPGLMIVPRYRLCGTVLITAAIRFSRDHGCDGRIGLHSLPQAEDFYRYKCGMTDLGADRNYEGLRYFEIMPSQATIIERGK